MAEHQRHYGLFTTITMIVGIVIGSGIFFKSDNILVATNGSVGLGVIVFCIAAISIIFGCLTLKSLAALTDKPGGVVAYSEEFIGKRFASAFGWFQVFIYYPTLTTVISWVVGIYISVLFGWDASLEQQVLLGICWFAICYAFNLASAKLGGAFQNISAVVKMIPLLAIGLIGFIFGDPAGALASPQLSSGAAMGAFGWLSAIGPIAFSFDGWIISTAIAFQIKSSLKNLPKALVAAPICILVLYLLYFVGVSAYVGPGKVMELGDESPVFIATRLFGPVAAKLVMSFVVISVMGTVNGIVLGFIRLPYSLALKNMLPHSKWLAKTGKGTDMPVNSGLFSIAVCFVWWIIHYFTTKYNILVNSDVSEIAIAMSYLLYIALYFKVFMFWRQGKIKGFANGAVFPALATVGSLFILTGALQNPLFLIFVGICLVALFAGYGYAAKVRL